MEKNMKREYKLFLEDIIVNIDLIKIFTEDMDFETFINDLKTIYSVTRALEIIGEAVGQIPVEIKKEFPIVKWKEIRGFRDKIIHRYWGVDLEIEWNIIKEELDMLKKQIKDILNNKDV
jgi:uncharacterized protein with HEPN domain